MKKIKKNKLGFTLVELLVAITIMGILMVLALPEARRLQENNKKKKFEKYSESLESAAKLYIDSHSVDLFGDAKNGCAELSLDIDLIGSKLAKDFNSNGISCNNDETYVKVSKKGSKYSYEVSLVCKDKNKQEIYRSAAIGNCTLPTLNGFGIGINRDGTGEKWISLAKAENANIYKNLVLTITSDAAFDAPPIIKYGWQKCSDENCSELLETKYHTVTLALSENKESSNAKIKNIPENGVYKLHVIPVSVHNELGEMMIDNNYRSKIYRLDSISPTIPEFNPRDGYGWKGKKFVDNKEYVFNLSTVEEGSGVRDWAYKYPDSDNTYTIYDNSNYTNFITTPFTKERNEDVRIRVCDKADNCSSNKMKISIDKKYPTITVNVTDGKTYAKSHKANIKINDTGGSSLKSGPINLYYGFGTSAPACSSLTKSVNVNIPASANSATSQDITINSGTGAGKLYVCTKDNTLSDAAGNAIDVSELFDSDMYLDNTGPVVSASVGTTWTDNKVVITANATDSNVGTIGGYYISTSTTAPSASATGWQTGKTFSKGTGTYYIWAKDSLGNVSSSYATAVVPAQCVLAANTLSKASVTVNEKSTSTVTITDGTVNSATSSDTSIATVSASGSKITITGASYGSATITVVMPKGSNCSGTVTKTISVTVTPVYYYSGNNYYTNLSTAVSSVSAGSTINVYRNVSESTTPTLNKNVTLNLNGKTITYSGSTLNVEAGTFTITGSGTLKTTTSYSSSLLQASGGTLNIGTTSTKGESTPNITASGTSSAILDSSGTVNVYSGTLTSKNDGIIVKEGTLNFGKDGTSSSYPKIAATSNVANKNNVYAGIYINGDKNTVNIKSGYITAISYSSVYLVNGTLNVGTSATTSSKEYPRLSSTDSSLYAALYVNKGTFNMYGGLVENLGEKDSTYNGATGSVGLYVGSNYASDVILHGGLIYSKNACAIFNELVNHSFKINGDTHVVTASSANSAIHAQRDSKVYVGSDLPANGETIRELEKGAIMVAHSGYLIWISGTASTSNAQIGSSKASKPYSDYAPNLYTGITNDAAAVSLGGGSLYFYSGEVHCNSSTTDTFANLGNSGRTVHKEKVKTTGKRSYGNLTSASYNYLWYVS